MHCMIGGCDGVRYGLGLCAKHYQRLRATGSLIDGEYSRGSLEDRFRRKFVARSPNECWEWDGARTAKGYGAIQEGGRGSRLLLAHRVSYTIHKGDIPVGKLILHSCDNRKCVNPNHLRVGNQSDNVKEAIGKGRKFIPSPGKGEANPLSKLTLEQAKYIKAHTEMRLIDLARKFGVSLNCIRGVRIGRTWKDA